MKQTLFLVFLLFSTLFAAGQVQNVDSLVNLLNNNSTNAQQIELYYKIVDRYILFDLNKASEYAREGLKLAEKSGDRTMASKFNAFLGRIYNTKSNYDTAFVYWNKALDLAIAVKNKEQEASVNVGIGILYGRQEKQMQALEHFLKAFTIYENTGNRQRSLTILGNIASIYRAMDNNERAIYYLEKAKSIAEELGNDEGKFHPYYELSAIYFTQGKNDQALELAQNAYDISCKLENRVYKGAITEVLSAIYYENLKDYDNAWKYANECLHAAQEINDPIMIAGAWKVISNLYRVLEQYKESKDAAKKALEADPTNINIAINLYENILLSEILLGNKEEAETFFYQYIKIIKKHIDQNNREILANMETKYETEKKEMRIASLEKERELYIWLSIAGILLVFALVAILWQTKRNMRKEKQLIATRSVLDGEMRERTRLAQDLHDRLSGNLSAVKIELGGHAETLQNVRDKLDNCIRDIRDAAHGLMPTSLQLGLKVALADYAAQFPNVKFHFFGEERRIDKRAEFVLYCCANELVNNSVRHSGADTINLQLVQDEKYATLTVSDDGSGYDEKITPKGMGLKNIRDRVASCNGKIDISTSPGKGTETTIELKIDKKS